MYGNYTNEQRTLIQETVKDQDVIDLGCGIDMGWIPILMKTARSVIGVDKELRYGAVYPDKRVTLHRTHYHNYKGVVPKVAFLSWPPNYELKGLIDILIQVDVIIYNGSNRSPVACGFSDLYAYFLLRELIRYEEYNLSEWKNTNLIVLGKPDGRIRRPVDEEILGMHLW